MRVALAVGGQLRMSNDTLELTHKLWRDAFPTADFLFAVWREDLAERPDMVEMLRRDGEVCIIDEYDIDYHPYDDNKDMYTKWNYQKKIANPNPERHLHQTKQILNHNTLMKKYGSSYDVIIRTRFDSIVSPIQNFDNYLKDVHETGKVISMQVMPEPNHKLKFFSVHGSGVTRNSMMVSDGGIIIHRSSWWDSELVETLHNNKRLLAAEFGWYQALVGNRDVEYVVYDGASHLTRCVSKHDMTLTKEWMNQ